MIPLLERLITLFGGIIGIAVLVFTIWQMSKEARLSRLMPIVTAGMTTITTLAYVFISGASVNLITAFVLTGLGFFIGLLQGQATRIYYRDRVIFGKRSVVYMVLWGLSYLMTLAFSQLGSAALHAFGILGMMFSLGVALGSNLNLFVRQLILRPEAVNPPSFPSNPYRPTNLPR